jgi:hypothetical protein
MASRGSALSRARKYFETADLEEVEVAFELVARTVKARLAARDASAKSQRNALSTPRKQRRTKAQIAADAATQVGAAPGTQQTLTTADL